jgi:FkbM family methyltransferase
MTTEEEAAVRAIANQHLVNADEAAQAFIEGLPLPPLHLKCGLTVYHGREDPAAILLGEIFHGTVYTGNDFYNPRAGDVVLDLGANIGIFTIFLLSLERNLRIHCFEPAAQTRQRLERNIASNGLEQRVRIYPFALYSRNATMQLKPTASSGDKSLFERWNTIEGESEEEVECISLSGALRVCGEEYVDLLKMDIEGAEVEVLEGASDVEWHRIRKICLEYHNFLRPDSGRRVMNNLERYGFKQIEFNDSPTLGIIKATRGLEST